MVALTYRQLVDRALQDSGISSRGVTSPTVAEATGIVATAARFVNEAWKNIQQDNENWFWMRKSFSWTIVGGKDKYQPHDVVANQPFRSWLVSDNDWYITDEVNGAIRGAVFPRISYQTYRLRTAGRSGEPNRRPVFFSIAPSMEILVYPTPDGEYVVDGEYQRGVYEFQNDDDLPADLPDDYHDMIKWYAVMMLNHFDEAVESQRFAAEQYATKYNNLKRTHLPGYTIAPAVGAEIIRSSAFRADTFVG